MMFEQRSDLAEVVGLRIVDPEDRVRIAHADGRRRVQDRRAGWTDLELDGARVGEGFGERNLVPAKARLAHVDGEQAAVAAPARNEAGLRLEGERAAAGLFADQSGDAAHAVAAGAGFGAVIVVDADQKLLPSRARGG